MLLPLKSLANIPVFEEFPEFSGASLEAGRRAVFSIGCFLYTGLKPREHDQSQHTSCNQLKRTIENGLLSILGWVLRIHARPFVGVFKVNFHQVCQLLTTISHKMAPRTGKSGAGITPRRAFCGEQAYWTSRSRVKRGGNETV